MMHPPINTLDDLSLVDEILAHEGRWLEDEYDWRKLKNPAGLIAGLEDEVQETRPEYALGLAVGYSLEGDELSAQGWMNISYLESVKAGRDFDRLAVTKNNPVLGKYAEEFFRFAAEYAELSGILSAARKLYGSAGEGENYRRIDMMLAGHGGRT